MRLASLLRLPWQNIHQSSRLMSKNQANLDANAAGNSGKHLPAQHDPAAREKEQREMNEIVNTIEIHGNYDFTSIVAPSPLFLPSSPYFSPSLSLSLILLIFTETSLCNLNN